MEATSNLGFNAYREKKIIVIKIPFTINFFPYFIEGFSSLTEFQVNDFIEIEM